MSVSGKSKRQAVATRIAAIQRHNGPDDPRLPELRQELLALDLEAHITRIVNTAPGLKPEDAERLRDLLGPAVQDGDAA